MKRIVLVTTAVIAILVFVTCAATTFAAIVVSVIDTREVEPVALIEEVEPTFEVDQQVDQQVDDDSEVEPSSTVTARPTRTLRPSATPLPSDTPTRRSTNTPRPTSTPRPSNTPQPTSTPPPTNTPRPTATPQSTNPPTALPTATALPPSPTATPVPILPTNTPAATAGNEQTAVVSRVIDGDTIEVIMNGAFYRVRYIGINTPESNEPCGREATLANSALVAGRTVRLVKDVSETDQYDRLLRYVYLGDLFVNAKLVADGWAEAVAYPPDTAFASYFESLEAQAVGQTCGVQPTATQPPPAAPPPPSGNCDPSYPTVCIPPAPPDLDCGDIPHRRFTVLPPDPHGFDGDNDGSGCESG